MKSLESRIPHFYDVLDEELENAEHLRALFLDAAREHGFTPMRTTAMELRERYTAATQVHYSKIFEVHRVKEGSRYALQADLAMGMSRFVADLPSPPPLKLAQINTLYRDRQLDLPGYRREFEMALLGVWGVRSPLADAELVALTHDILHRIPGIRPGIVQMTNLSIFNRLAPGLAQRLRFEDRSIDEQLALVDGLDNQDRSLLSALFASGQTVLGELADVCRRVGHPVLRQEMTAVRRVADLFSSRCPDAEVRFSLRDLKGTGHYSGLNYQIFATAPAVPDPFLIADGGRIDHLCRLLNRNDIPAVCMGLGTTVLAQLMTPPRRQPRVLVLVDDLADATGADRALLVRQQIAAGGMSCAVLPLPRRKWASVFRSDFYAGHVFVRCEGGRLSARGGPGEARQRVERLLAAEEGNGTQAAP